VAQEGAIKGIPGLSSVGLGTPLLVVMMLAMVMLPLPPFLLDLLFTFNISFGLVVILAVIYCKKPLDFAIFPTILLVSTLLRLALNVASTRVVLLNGHTGTDAAGKVVEAFGEVVIGGNYAVGLVVFAILVIINFVVVTKGGGRISEVSARFTLDAMPGKQMAIDADLNAGSLTQEQAKARREEVANEADFYGAMDGASKFVRGDAVAGILILIINMVGGLAIGIVQHDMSFSNAMQNYALLTIGDGLVAQIPSILLSTAAAMMVTRVSSDQDLGGQILSQVFGNPRVLYITAAVMGILGAVPGMPHLVFFGLAAAIAVAAYQLDQKHKQDAQRIALEESVKPQEEEAPIELSWDDVSPVDTIGLEVGYKLIPLVDLKQNGQLMKRIKGVRKKLSQDLGFLVPAVHIRDNLDLQPNEYRVILMGVAVGQAEVHGDKLLAINPGKVFGNLEGIPCKDPAFGLDAVWIDDRHKEHAQSLGYTVVDTSTVVATHLSHVLQSHAFELLGHEEAQHLIDRLAEKAPKLAEELVPGVVPLSVVVKVLQGLLTEGVPIRDMRSIAEAITEHGTKSADPDYLLSVVRVSLGRLVVQGIVGNDTELPVITLAPELEQILLQSLQGSEGESAGFEPGLAEKLQNSLFQALQQQELQGQPAVLLVPAMLRTILARFARFSVPGMHVLSYQEIPETKHLRVVSTVG